MKHFAFSLLFLGISHFSFAADFFVSPWGNDSNPGTKQAPFSTIEKAQLMVLERMRTNPGDNCIVWLQGGEYLIKDKLLFNTEEFKRVKKLTFHDKLMAATEQHIVNMTKTAILGILTHQYMKN